MQLSSSLITMQFTEKVVLLTGASSGIGYATAKLFAKYGASLALTDRNIMNLKQVAVECQENQSKNFKPPFVVAGELTNEKDIKTILEKTIAQFGKLDILVNNAGILETGSIENTSLEQYDRVMNTNVRSIYHLTSLAVPYLIQSKGNIVNTSSVDGIRSFPGILAYCLSKAAVDQFTRCVALELGSKQVRVNCVNPGVIITNLHKTGGMNQDEYEQFLKRCQETHALGRPGTAEEVAKSILFLASDDASNSTGVSLLCDGGRHTICPR